MHRMNVALFYFCDTTKPFFASAGDFWFAIQQQGNPPEIRRTEAFGFARGMCQPHPFWVFRPPAALFTPSTSAKNIHGCHQKRCCCYVPFYCGRNGQAINSTQMDDLFGGSHTLTALISFFMFVLHCGLLEKSVLENGL